MTLRAMIGCGLACVALAAGAGREAGAQAAVAARGARPLNVFLDCHDCDFNYLRDEIRAINWVRDRTVADVHVQVATQSTGGGGSARTLIFIGGGAFAGKGDTLMVATEPGAVDDEVRAQMGQALKVGLATMVARTSGLGAVTISFAPSADSSSVGSTRDPWNAWVFRASLDGSTSGDQTTRSLSGSSQLEARRVTAAWKTEVSFAGEYEESKFDLSEGGSFTGIQRTYEADVLQAKSVSAHFSIGLKGGFASSTYSNERRAWKLAPALEYDVFPYDEITRRQITLQYALGLARYDYADTTIYLKTREDIPIQSFAATATARQPWGSVSLRARLRNHVNDPSKRRATLSGNLSVRIAQGLTVNVGGHVSNIRDQTSLPKDPATDEQILVRQREQATSYNFSTNFGFSYSFGSIFNNIVNPRFNSIDFF